MIVDHERHPKCQDRRIRYPTKIIRPVLDESKSKSIYIVYNVSNVLLYSSDFGEQPYY